MPSLGLNYLIRFVRGVEPVKISKKRLVSKFGYELSEYELEKLTSNSEFESRVYISDNYYTIIYHHKNIVLILGAHINVIFLISGLYLFFSDVISLDLYKIFFSIAYLFSVLAISRLIAWYFRPNIILLF